MIDYSPETMRAARLHLGLTQEDAVKRLGVSMATMNRWENGRSRPISAPHIKAVRRMINEAIKAGLPVKEATRKQLREAVKQIPGKIQEAKKSVPSVSFTADEVTDMRTELGLTQEAFAKEIGVNWQKVKHWEADYRKCNNPKHVQKIADLLIRRFTHPPEESTATRRLDVVDPRPQKIVDTIKLIFRDQYLDKQSELLRYFTPGKMKAMRGPEIARALEVLGNLVKMAEDKEAPGDVFVEQWRKFGAIVNVEKVEIHLNGDQEDKESMDNVIDAPAE